MVSLPAGHQRLLDFLRNDLELGVIVCGGVCSPFNSSTLEALLGLNSKKQTIYVIDDEKTVAALVESILLAEGYEVFVSYDGFTALEEVDEHSLHVDLFLIDVVLPNINGPDLATKLKQRCKKAAILFTSGYGEGAGKALQQSNPDAHFLAKPFKVSQLTAAVQSALAG